MYRPKNLSEYIDLVEQAIFEVEELKAADEWEQEEDHEALGFIGPLHAQLHELDEQLHSQRHSFGNGDLPLMSIVRAHARQIPFSRLFDIINQTHRLGLEDPEDHECTRV